MQISMATELGEIALKKKKKAGRCGKMWKKVEERRSQGRDWDLNQVECLQMAIS